MLNSFNRLFSSGNKVDEQSIEQFNEDEVVQLPVEKIIPNQFQPRTVFKDEKIDELAQTLKTHGIIQPIVVRQMEEEGQYEVIAGERRLRAAKLLEWDTISTIIRNLTDTETASVALIENIQREQLSAIEEASAYTQLLELHELTQEALAQRLGKSQSTVANRIRLLKLIPEAQTALLNKEITERHGRTLLKLDEKLQKTYLDRVIKEELNVKDLEELIDKVLQKDEPKKKRKKAQIISKDIRIATNTIKESLKMITNTGIKVESEEEELEDYYQVTIRIKK
ncbi:MAG TPA: nucleoid occlusion protein [Pseudogracilibacillus sp.]|nr:nucleoid occlusion protein [Pseudogracilibacillus sp.]